MLEAVVYPSSSFVRSYEPTIVKGKTTSALGIIIGDTPEEVVVRSAPGVETHIPRADVLSFQPAATSLMPQGYDGILTPTQLADLIAYLASSK